MNPNQVRTGWEERSGEYSPDYYAYYGPDETSESIRGLFDSSLDSNAAVLELGCSSGRHLAHLHEHGYDDLHGVEINDDAFDVMADAYPDLADAGTFYADAIENVVPEFDDDRFDAVFSVEVLQHLHPDHEWVFGELARITTDRLVTVENEGDGEDEDDGEVEGDANGDPIEFDDELRDSDGQADESNDLAEEPDKQAEELNSQAVNFVDDGVPLYYRNWRRIFTQRGFTEVAAESNGRDTLRAFRPTGQ